MQKIFQSPHAKTPSTHKASSVLHQRRHTPALIHLPYTHPLPTGHPAFNTTRPSKPILLALQLNEGERVLHHCNTFKHATDKIHLRKPDLLALPLTNQHQVKHRQHHRAQTIPHHPSYLSQRVSKHPRKKILLALQLTKQRQPKHRQYHRAQTISHQPT